MRCGAQNVRFTGWESSRARTSAPYVQGARRDRRIRRIGCTSGGRLPVCQGLWMHRKPEFAAFLVSSHGCTNLRQFCLAPRDQMVFVGVRLGPAPSKKTVMSD